MQPSTRTVRVIWETARTIFGEVFPHFSPDDQIVVEERTRPLILTYVSSRMSPDARDLTRLELCFHLDRSEMWISWLAVATQLRLVGVGSQLVNVAETIAQAIGVQSICVFPLVSANTFWEKMGYFSHLGAARVLCKQLNVSTSTRTELATGSKLLLL